MTDYMILAEHPTASDLYYRGVPKGLFADPTKVWVGSLLYEQALEMTLDEAETLAPTLQAQLATRQVRIVRSRGTE